MVKRDRLIKSIYELIGPEWLEKAGERDELANGVQILGEEKVNKVALGVSLNEEFLVEAVKRGANLCIFHHGLDTRAYKACLSLPTQKRLRLIFANQLTILGFHYVLDAHPTLGNNAVIIKKLGATLDQPLFEDWGYTAKFAQPQTTRELVRRCAKLFHHEIFSVLSGPKRVTTIGVVSGAGKPQDQHLAEMHAKGVELFISGETAESIPHKMQEAGINYFAGGHYASEVFGVQELGRAIKQAFSSKLALDFIDIPNPI